MDAPARPNFAPTIMPRYLRPRSLDEALRALAGGGVHILAGGTDFFPARVGRAIDDDVLDITAIDELRGVRENEQGFRLGALVTWADVARARLPACFDGLKLAAREVGGAQIQNAGTVVGNLCNASPAADGVPALLALDARVELARADAVRSLPLGEFITGNRQTQRAPEEMVTAIHVPRWSESARSHFLKLGARKYLVISISMVAGVLEPDAHGAIAQCAFAVGACSSVAKRLPDLERGLVGAPLGGDVVGRVRDEHLAPLAPLSDVRGSAEYRLDATRVLLARLLEALVRE
jgi:CO/xanthine dehydrogenase FAD-binding subunit